MDTYFVEILNFEGPFKFRIIFAKLETNKGPLGLVSMATMLRIHANVDAFLNGSSDILGKNNFFLIRVQFLTNLAKIII